MEVLFLAAGLVIGGLVVYVRMSARDHAALHALIDERRKLHDLCDWCISCMGEMVETGITFREGWGLGTVRSFLLHNAGYPAVIDRLRRMCPARVQQVAESREALFTKIEAVKRQIASRQ